MTSANRATSCRKLKSKYVILLIQAILCLLLLITIMMRFIWRIFSKHFKRYLLYTKKKCAVKMDSYCIHRAILSVIFEEVLSIVAIITDKGVIKEQ